MVVRVAGIAADDRSGARSADGVVGCGADRWMAAHPAGLGSPAWRRRCQRGGRRVPARRRDPKKVLSCIRSRARDVATAASERSIAADTGLLREAVSDELGAFERLMILAGLQYPSAFVTQPAHHPAPAPVRSVAGHGAAHRCSSPCHRSTSNGPARPRSWPSSPRPDDAAAGVMTVSASCRRACALTGSFCDAVIDREPSERAEPCILRGRG